MVGFLQESVRNKVYLESAVNRPQAERRIRGRQRGIRKQPVAAVRVDNRWMKEGKLGVPEIGSQDAENEGTWKIKQHNES